MMPLLLKLLFDNWLSGPCTCFTDLCEASRFCDVVLLVGAVPSSIIDVFATVKEIPGGNVRSNLMYNLLSNNLENKNCNYCLSIASCKFKFDIFTFNVLNKEDTVRLCLYLKSTKMFFGKSRRKLEKTLNFKSVQEDLHR